MVFQSRILYWIASIVIIGTSLGVAILVSRIKPFGGRGQTGGELSDELDTSHTEPNRSDWMLEYYPLIKSKRLSDLCIPASHNAASYAIEYVFVLADWLLSLYAVCVWMFVDRSFVVLCCALSSVRRVYWWLRSLRHPL